MKKNLPSPTRCTVVEIRVNKLQANPVSGHIERGARPLPATDLASSTTGRTTR